MGPMSNDEGAGACCALRVSRYKDGMKIKTWVLCCIVLVILAVVISTPFLVQHFSAGECLETAGQFGDMFGAANAFFSALGLIAITFTLKLQLDELASSRGDYQQQVSLAAKSARLAALPSLIHSLTSHLRETYPQEALEIAMETMDAQSITDWLSKAKTSKNVYKVVNYEMVVADYSAEFLDGIRTVARYKADLENLYHSLESLEKVKTG